jgi:hypothetical protein
MTDPDPDDSGPLLLEDILGAKKGFAVVALVTIVALGCFLVVDPFDFIG